MADAALSAAPFALSDRPTEPELVARYCRALGDPTRVRILELPARNGELSVADVVAHLATRREHPSVLYRIAGERVSQLLALVRGLLADHG